MTSNERWWFLTGAGLGLALLLLTGAITWHRIVRGTWPRGLMVVGLTVYVAWLIAVLALSHTLPAEPTPAALETGQ